MHSWKTIKIFVSSTFLDLEKERDDLSKVFRDLQKDAIAKHLHIVPYDLRWQDQNDPNLVRWCIDKVEQCQYFVGIIRDRYGWEPSCDYFGEENTARISVTEMEIRKALKCIPKENRIFYFLGESNCPKITALKELLKGEDIANNSENIANNSENIAENVYKKLKKMVDENYSSVVSVAPNNDNYLGMAQQTMDEKSIGFVGRNSLLKKLDLFCKTPAQDIMVIEGVAGIGKSALVSQFVKETSLKKLIHYVGNYEKQSLYHLQRSLGQQLIELGFIKELHYLPDKLAFQIQETLQNIDEPVVIVIDGVDEFENINDFLQWWPKQISSCVHVFWTARPVACLDKVQKIIIGMMDNDDLCSIIASHRNIHKITDEQQKLLLEYAAGNPLYLKIALEEITQGGTAVGQLAKNIDSLFEQIVQRLQSKYGQEIVNDCLGIIAASSSGLSEMELRECLASHKNYQVFCIEISESLASFLAPHKDLYKFFHIEFERSIKMMLGRSKMRSCHQMLASYFWKKGFEYDGCLVELPFQLQWGELYKQLLEVLSDINFLQRKCDAGKLVELLHDLQFAAETTIMPIPNDLQIIVEKTNVNRTTLRWIKNAIEADLAFLIKSPENLVQCLWNRCFWHDTPTMENHYSSSIIPVDSNIHELAKHWQKKIPGRLWLKSVRPLPSRLDSPLRKVLRGHKFPVHAMVLSESKMFLISGDQRGKVRIWETSTGKCVRVINAYEQDITSLTITVDDKKVVCGSFDEKIKVFDIKSGECIYQLIGHRDAAIAVACTPCGEYIISASIDRTIRVWQIKSGACVSHMMSSVELNHLAVYDNKHIIVGGGRNIELWNIENLECVSSVKETADISCLRLYNKAIYCSLENKTISKWDICEESLSIKPSPVFTLERHTDIISDLCIRGNTLISCSFDKTVGFWDLENKKDNQFTAHDGWVSAMCLDDTTLYTASWDSSIRIWNLSNIDNPLYTLKGHSDDMEGYSVSPDKQSIISWGKDHFVNIWNLPKGRLTHSMPRQKGHLESIAVTSDTKNIFLLEEVRALLSKFGTSQQENVLKI